MTTILDKARGIVETGNRKPVLGLLAGIVSLVLMYGAYVHITTPISIREPLLEHYHFRLQVVVNDKSEDFSKQPYQIPYVKDQCSSLLSKEPIHFHDNKDQFVHIHWEGVTGGQVLKYYGWNYISGPSNTLGYRMDKHKLVPIHGFNLPKISDDVPLHVYSGTTDNFRERDFDDWKNKDLEDFFGVTSNFPAHNINKQKRSVLDLLFPKLSAHTAVETSEQPDAHHTSEEDKLKKINNLLGNVVIFAQKKKPSQDQVKERFENLVPLSTSTCGG